MTMPVMDPALTHAYDTCRRMHRRHDPTYYWATRRLPAAAAARPSAAETVVLPTPPLPVT